MLHVKFSNRFELLEDALLDAMAMPPASPFSGEEVIVPSAAIQRRIELAAADRFGICSNVRFSFLAQWLWRQIGHVVPVAEISPFTTPVLTWRIFGIFGEKAFVEAHAPLARYLGDADDVMRYELAARIAALLEQYLTYRPDWLAAWLAGKPANIAAIDKARAADERWQAALWRRIARDLGTDSRHPSVTFFDAMTQLGPEAPARAGLPASAHVFCPPATPPLYLEILHRLAQWIDLRLYVLNPCREYWFEIVDPRRVSWLAAEHRAEHHEVGNRLLAAWGKQTQAHIDMLLEADGPAVVDDADFAPSEGVSLLVELQNAILDLTDLPRGSLSSVKGESAADRSIEVHVCHSLTRELEVLQDQLLALFAGANPPRPCDILVVTPDLEAAAPLIDAVFGNAPNVRAIPYAITGRPASAFNACARALLAVLGVATSRFQASAVFELLQQPIVARRFGIRRAELDALHGWVRDSGIRWGIDGKHRAALGLPAVDRHSFVDGLDRLFLGYALPASVNVPLNGRLAAGNPEGSEALGLGSFREFVRQLAHLHQDLANPKTTDDWRQALTGVLENFLAPVGGEIDDERATTAAIGELHRTMANGGMRTALPVDVVRTALQALLDDPTRGGVPGGAVTFAAMASLRNLPYRCVFAIGLNDGAFPSPQRPSEFDLLTRAPRRGDRQRRTDERNLFLDLLLAARERLYLSYTGKSVRDNSPIPPSVLVAELLDYCAAATDRAPFSPDSLAAARRRLTVEHPLQAFSLDYFKPDAEPRRRSFNEEYCEALKLRLAASSGASAPAEPSVAATGAASAALEGEDGGGETEDDTAAWEPQASFFPAPLPPAGPEFRDMTLASLARFFANPCRYLLQERLGIVLPRGDEELDDAEPFVPDRFARGALAQRVLPRLLEGESAASLRAFARAGIEYPPGRLGDIELDQELQWLERFARRLVPALAEPKVDPVSATLEFSIGGESWRLTGGFGDLRRSGLVRYRYDDARALDYLTGWLEHLFLNAMAPPEAERSARTTWYSRDGHYVLPRVGDAREQLEALLGLCGEGLDRPIHFFPRSAWAYISQNNSRAKAAAAWKSTRDRAYGEDRDPAYRLALRGTDEPLDAQFIACATTVFQPLLAAIVDSRLARAKNVVPSA